MTQTRMQIIEFYFISPFDSTQLKTRLLYQKVRSIVFPIFYCFLSSGKSEFIEWRRR